MLNEWIIFLLKGVYWFYFHQWDIIVIFTHIFTSAGLCETSFLALLMCYRISILKNQKQRTQYFHGCHPSILSSSIVLLPLIAMGFPGGSDGKTICQQCRKPRSYPWVGKISWWRKWQPTPVFLPEKSHRQKNLAG